MRSSSVVLQIEKSSNARIENVQYVYRERKRYLCALPIYVYAKVHNTPIHVRIRLWRNKIDSSQAAGIDRIRQVRGLFRLNCIKYHVRVNIHYIL